MLGDHDVVRDAAVVTVEQPLGDLHRRNRLGPRDDGHGRLRSMRRAGLDDEAGEHLRHGHVHRCVARVAERDDTPAGRRMPAHVGAEAGVAAGVGDDPAEHLVMHRHAGRTRSRPSPCRPPCPSSCRSRRSARAPASPAATTGRRGGPGRRRARPRSFRRPSGPGPRLSRAGRPWRSRRPARPAARARESRPPSRDSRWPAGPGPSRAASNPVDGMPSGAQSRSRTTCVNGVPAAAEDDTPQQRVAGVGVLEHRARRPARGEAARPPGRRTRRAAATPADPPTDRPSARPPPMVSRSRTVTAGMRRASEGTRGGYVVGHRVVEPEPALVAQQEHGRCGERLRHRRDAEHGVGTRGRATDRRRAVAARMDEHSVVDDAERDAGDGRQLGGAGEHLVGDRGSVGSHRLSSLMAPNLSHGSWPYLPRGSGFTGVRAPTYPEDEVLRTEAGHE